ncbi:MAG: NAD(P)-dependent oxidoreductase [Balneolaceae bacterium]|nr:NAD(P)-dependent oxidoreductase [Balneolaceae bacterium]
METIKNTVHSVTILGLGSMGTALANSFLKNGYKTTVWNRTAQKAVPLVKAGAIQAETVEDALLASPLVIICLLDYDVIYETLGKLGRDTLKGCTIVNLTNGTPQEARGMAEHAEKSGTKAYLDGGIMAVPSLISTEHAFILYSGSPTAFEQYESALSVLGGTTYMGSDSGLASLVDLALLSGMYGLFGGFLHAVALVKSENVKAEEFSSTLLIPWLQAMISVMPEMAKQIDSKNYSGAESNIAMQEVGYRNILQASIDQGVDTRLLEPFQTLLKQRVADGYEKEDLAGLFELIKSEIDHNYKIRS